MSTSQNEPTVDHERATADMTLSDYVQRAAVADVVEESDGSTVVYLHLRQLERFSTLPRPKWQGWFSRVLGNKPTAPATDSLGESVNVRRVPRDLQK
ncbi:MAG: hypothetical protein BMS9Abin17_1660 [Acidimicrobiia bacterium]|nr:MAG: hypothetical protein BMS9Abin17_1660 [Acidimicrobiia bacterium]